MFPVSRPRFTPRPTCLLIVWSLTALTGCGGVGDVSGEVRVKGKIVPFGTIAFLPQESTNEVLVAQIQEGKYRVEKVPTGMAIVVVKTPDPAMFGGAAPAAAGPAGGGDGRVPPAPSGAPARKGPLVNRRYEEPGTSGLEYTVKRG